MISAFSAATLSAKETSLRPAIRFGEKLPKKKVVTPEQEAMDKQYAAKSPAAKQRQKFMSMLVPFVGSTFSLGILLPYFMKEDFYLLRGGVQLIRERFAEAEADYLKALSLEEARSIKNVMFIYYVLHGLADACEALGKHSEAEQYRQRAAIYKS